MNMTTTEKSRLRIKNGTRSRLIAAGSFMAVALLASMNLQAFVIDTGNSDLQLRWDNTFKYNLVVRAQKIDKRVVGKGGALAILGDDADLGWKRGDIVNNRLDLLSEMDLIWKENFGVRVSAAAWYDEAYSGKTAHPGYNPYLIPGVYADTWGAISVPPGELTKHAKDLNYKDMELLDAFIFGSFNVGEQAALSFRLGRHSLYWGNSLYLAGAVHGIAGSMSTIDANKGFSVPGTSAKELFRPTNKLSATLQVSQNTSLEAYYSFEFEPVLMPALGSYQSPAEGLTNDDEFLTLIPGRINPQDLSLISPRIGYSKVEDKEPNGGEWGIGLKHYFQDSGWEVGAYYLNYHDALPQGLNGAVDFGQFASLQAAGGDPTFGYLVANWAAFNNGVPAPFPDVYTGGGYPAYGIGTWNWVYKKDNKLIGLSLANELWGISWGADFVYRMDTPINTFLGGQLVHIKNIPEGIPDDVDAALAAGLGAQGFRYDFWDFDAQDEGNYPGMTGDSWHVVVNALGFLKPNKLWDGGTYIVEMTFSSLAKVKGHPELRHPDIHKGKLTTTLAINLTPTWYQVLPSLDVKVPVNFGYTFTGEAPPLAFGGTEEYGSGSFGVGLEYKQQWFVDLKYNYNIGPRLPALDGQRKDRGNVALTIQRTF